MTRDSFIFYKSWWDAVGLLPGDMRGEVLTAIIEYGLTGETNSRQGNTTRAILELIKPQIDANNVKYDNGRKGGRPRSDAQVPQEPNGNQVETKAEPNANQQETESKPRRNRTGTKAEPNVYVNDNVNVNDNVSSSRTRETSDEVTGEEKEEFYEIFFFRNFQDPAREVERFIAWNGKQGKRPTRYDAELWNPEVKEKRFSEGFIKAWKALYTTAKFSGPDGEDVAAHMLDNRLVMKAVNDKWQLQCPEKVAAWLNNNQETATEILKPALRGHPLGIKTYRIR